MVLSESYSLHCEGRLGTDEEGSLWECVPEDDDPLESTSSLLYFSVYLTRLSCSKSLLRSTEVSYQQK